MCINWTYAFSCTWGVVVCFLVHIPQWPNGPSRTGGPMDTYGGSEACTIRSVWFKTWGKSLVWLEVEVEDTTRLSKNHIYIYMHIMCKITSLESPTSTWYWILASFTEHDDDKWWQWCWFIFRWVALRRAVFLALTVMFMPLSIFALLHRYVQRGTFSSGTSTMMWHRRMTTCSEAEG